MIEIDKNEERIIRIVRKHWFVLLSDLFVLVFFIGLPSILIFGAEKLVTAGIIAVSGSTIYAGGFFLFAWLAIVWMIAWNIWTDYYLDVLIITDKRIFDIDQKGLFRRTSSSFRIDRIQNITVEIKGIIQTILDFGTLRLETAGEREDFVATFIKNPYEIKKFINVLQDEESAKSTLVHIDDRPDSERDPHKAHFERKTDSEGF